MKVLLDALKLAGEDFSESLSIADLFDEDQNLVYVNSNFALKTGYTREEVVGNNCRFLQGDLTDRDMVTNIRSSIRDRISCYFDIVNYKKNGEKFWNRLLLIPFGISDESIRYIVGIQMDITEKHGGNFEKKVPYACFSPSENYIKDKLEEVVNFYRSFRYFEGTDHDTNHSNRIKELADRSRVNLQEICDSVRKL